MEGVGVALAWEHLTDFHLANNWLVAFDKMKMRTDKGYYLAFSPDSPVAQNLRNWVEAIKFKPNLAASNKA